MLDFIFIKDGLVKSVDIKKGNKEEEELYAGFKRAGFSHNVTFYLISVVIIQLIGLFIVLNLISNFTRFFVKQFFSIKWKYKLDGFTKAFIQFSLLTYPIRFLLENFMKLWGTFNIEAN